MKDDLRAATPSHEAIGAIGPAPLPALHVGPDWQRSVHCTADSPRAESPADRKLAPANVLVVDDDDTDRMLARHCLEQGGFAVREAADGLEALDETKRHRPDIILLDVEMPRLDGFTTWARLREIQSTATVPILMVTGMNDSQSIDRAYALGATDFATKPLNWSLLSHRLRYMLRASETVQQLAREQTRLAKAQRISGLGSWEWDLERDTMVWSAELYRILGSEPGAVTASRDALLCCVQSGDRPRVAAWISEFLDGGDSVGTLAYRISLPDHTDRDVQQQIEATIDLAGRVTHLNGTLQDITERQRAEAKIHQLAYFDGLTSLPNRLAFRERLGQALALAKRYDRLLAVLFLDLDDFKRVNDTLGHNVGDLLLKAVAESLLTSVRQSDAVTHRNVDDAAEVVARLGGDEFTILLAEISKPQDASTIAHRILRELSKSFTLAGHEVFVTPSIGIAIFPHDGVDVDTLLKNADTAMYFAKKAGKNLFQFYEESMNEAALKRLTLDTNLRKAMERGEFSIHYQPQMDLTSGHITAVEALLRWNSAELGSVSPAEFIALAEENGLIVPINEWVLRTACAEVKAWADEGLLVSRVGVNISVLQFARPDFPELVSQILRDTGLAPALLELEITERVLANDVDSTIRILRALKDIGVQLSIDDFGTGYSSLSQLKHFPIDRLKIDQSFVREIASDPDDAAIALAVIGMADSMNLAVVAEGVETEAQLEFLRAKHCDEMQGYYLSRPLPSDELAVLLRAHQDDRGQTASA